MRSEIFADNFAGGGGASTGIEIAIGGNVDIAINHDPDAIAMHKANHPDSRHYCEDVWEVDPVKACEGRPVALAWFSPDCKHFSRAKGGKPVDKNIRGLAWVSIRWALMVRPRVIMLENVPEIQTWCPLGENNRPVKERSGETFRGFIKIFTTGLEKSHPAFAECCNALRIDIESKEADRLSKGLGYQVEYRELMSCDYGAPTSRTRFYMIARCDGKPIIWPERTHAPRNSAGVKSGRLKPWRSAAEIIDWSLPSYSIFASKREIKEKYGINAVRPLADNTMCRVIRGVDKFTIKIGTPFLLECNHSGDGHTWSVAEPVNTVTGKYTGGLCDPVLAPFIAQQKFQNAPQDITEPMTTITSVGSHELAAANLIQYHTEQTENVRATGLNTPIATIDAANRHGLVSAQLVEYYGNGNPLNVREPMHTVTAHDREALCAAHIVEFKGMDIGQSSEQPLRTVTAGGGEFAACRAVMAKVEPGKELGHWPQIRALLNKYCGYSMADDEIILLIIRGIAYFIADITLRMLTPRELYNAMGFPSSYIIDRDYTKKPYPKAKQVARCGNAVTPPVAAALVRANLPEYCGVKHEELDRAC